MAKRIQIKEIEAILDDFANEAHNALSHIGLANYSERISEAGNWVAVARNDAARKLIALLSGHV